MRTDIIFSIETLKNFLGVICKQRFFRVFFFLAVLRRFFSSVKPLYGDINAIRVKILRYRNRDVKEKIRRDLSA